MKQGNRLGWGVLLGGLLAASVSSYGAGQTPMRRPANPPSLVNVTDSRFASGCPNGADPYGKQDSTCAIRAAITYIGGNGTPGAGYPVLYFPHGIYKVAGEGFTSALTLTKAIGIQGDGSANTVLENTSPHGALLTYLKADDCSSKVWPCPIRVQGMTFSGEGAATDGGLIEIDSTNTGSMHDVVLAETGGRALNLQGSSERWYFEDMEVAHTRWPVLLEGDTNENYFNRVNVLEGGATHDYCWSVNCPGGKLIQPGAVWLPDPHSSVYLDGDNVHWMNSSIKSTSEIGGIRLATTTSSVEHTYIEGFPWGDQPRTNHAIAAPGKMELGHLTSGISASDLAIPVDDAGWQPLYVNDPSQAAINDQHSYVNGFGIFPADYEFGSKEPSRAVPGITRGDVELLSIAAFSGDGKAHVIRRGVNSRAIAWPAGSVIEQVSPNGYGTQRLEENHFNSLGTDYSKYKSGCSDTVQRKDKWMSSPSVLCAEVIAGLVPDGFMVPFPTANYVHQGYALSVIDNSIYTGGREEDGEGWIKIPGNATVHIEQANTPLRGFVDKGTAMGAYSNGVSRVQVVSWPGDAGKSVSALAYVDDPAAGLKFSPQEGFYSADVNQDGGLQHQVVGTQCWENTIAGSAQPDSRVCMGDGGAMTAQTRVNGRWTGGASRAAASPSGNAVTWVMRDWQVNLLAARGQSGDCQSREQVTGGVKFSTAPDKTLIVNLSPNPGAAVTATGAVEGDGSKVAVRLCNTGSQPVRWEAPPTVLFTQLP